jgi:predicted N-acyltransferase
VSLGETRITARFHDQIGAIAAADWDACAGAANPFLSHAFLHALETSGSAVAGTGWAADHVTLEDETGRILACAPAYLKTHSYGEYVFDHGWANAYAQYGERYFPKLLAAVPFTPVPGPRFLIHPQAPAGTAAAVVKTLEHRVAGLGISSAHANFCDAETQSAFAAAGWLRRTGVQFHWANDGYACFEDFLTALSSRKRKMIRKEREAVREAGVTCRALTGAALEEKHWDAFYRFYLATTDRKWGSPYLTRAFFTALSETMADKVLLVLAERDGKFIAGALNLIGADALYGRNWGAVAHVPCLHFEACYYQAIEWAIGRGLARVEAGAQGEHKLARGYLPVETVSYHHIADPRFRRAIADFLRRETAGVEDYAEELAEFSPFKRDAAEE